MADLAPHTFLDCSLVADARDDLQEATNNLTFGAISFVALSIWALLSSLSFAAILVWALAGTAVLFLMDRWHRAHRRLYDVVAWVDSMENVFELEDGDG